MPLGHGGRGPWPRASLSPPPWPPPPPQAYSLALAAGEAELSRVPRCRPGGGWGVGPQPCFPPTPQGQGICPTPTGPPVLHEISHAAPLAWEVPACSRVCEDVVQGSAWPSAQGSSSVAPDGAFAQALPASTGHGQRRALRQPEALPSRSLHAQAPLRATGSTKRRPGRPGPDPCQERRALTTQGTEPALPTHPPSPPLPSQPPCCPISPGGSRTNVTCEEAGSG